MSMGFAVKVRVLCHLHEEMLLVNSSAFLSHWEVVMSLADGSNQNQIAFSWLFFSHLDSLHLAWLLRCFSFLEKGVEGLQST